MRWFWRKRAPSPLLSDAEVARLYEEIFEEPVSIERLFMLFHAAPSADCEWVMDRRMFDRICRVCLDSPGGWYYIVNPVIGGQQHLIGLPVVIEPFAKLAIRERVAA